MPRRRLELQLDLTSRCNLRCVMCYFSATERLRFKPFDLEPGRHGDMTQEMMRLIASELFPAARTVGLGCAAEPLLSPQFCEVLELTRSHGVPDTWIQTNLLALTARTADAIVENKVKTVAVSIDGTTRTTYERIRKGASWDRLLHCIRLLRDARTRARSTHPRLRVTFVWMRSNRGELAALPEFARGLGASELDVRFVVPTVGVDTSGEVLDEEDRDAINAELWSAARTATELGLRLTAFPALRKEAGADNTVAGRLERRLLLLRAGIDGPKRWRLHHLERRDGCSFPGRFLLIRPNGAVLPCPFWEEDPVALAPRDRLSAILASAKLGEIRRGLQARCPIGSCRTCGKHKDAFFRPTPRGETSRS